MTAPQEKLPLLEEPAVQPPDQGGNNCVRRESTPRRCRWASSVRTVSRQHHSRSGFICREPTFARGPTRLPSHSPPAGVLLPLVGKPVHGLLGRRERNPDPSVLDNNGFFPTGGKHVRLPRRLLRQFSNPARAVSFPAGIRSESRMNKSSGYPRSLPGLREDVGRHLWTNHL